MDEMNTTPVQAQTGAPMQEAPAAATPAAQPVPQAGKPPKRRRKSWFARHKVLTVVLALLLAGGGFAFYRWKAAAAAASATTYQFVRTTTLQKTSLDQSVSVSGTVTSGSVASVTVADTAKTYKVSEVDVEVGDHVNSGDVICKLDTTDLEKSIASAQQNYTDTLQSAQIAYTRAKDAYDAYTTQHENNLIDLQAKITQADSDFASARSAVNDAQSAADSAAGTYNQTKAAYDSAKASITTYTNALSAAESNLNSSLSALNAAIANYNTYLVSCHTQFAADNTVDPADWGNLKNAASAMVRAYYNYNNNPVTAVTAGASGTTSAAAASAGNTVTRDAVNNEVNGLSVTKGFAAPDTPLGTGSSAMEIYTAAAARLNDAQTSCSAPALGLTGFTAIEAALKTADANKTSTASALDAAKTKLTAAEQTQKSAHDAYDNEKNYSNLKTLKQNVEDAALKLTQAKRTPDTLTTLQSTLAQCTLTASMTGTVTALNATVGSVPSGTVATIQDTSGLTVTVTIPADNVVDCTTGMRCYVTSDSTGDTQITGTLTQIDPVANDKGTFGAKITVTGDTSKLKIGMQAKAQILQSQTSDVFVVPTDAIATAEDGSYYVYRKTGGEGTDMTFEKVTVTPGTANDYYTEISGDTLKEGDVVRSSADLTQGIETADSRSAEEMAFGSDMGGAQPAEGGTPPSDGGSGGGAPPSGGGQ